MLDIKLDYDPQLLILGERVQDVVARKFSEFGDLLYAKVMENVSGKILQKQSGQLASSIVKEVDTAGDIITTTVGPQPMSPKAWALEKGGERYYSIVPTKAKILHFFSTKLGGEVFTHHVNHPPSRAFRYLGQALEEAEPIFLQGLKDTLSLALRE